MRLRDGRWSDTGAGLPSPLGKDVVRQVVCGGMNHNRPLGWVGLCFMPITFGFIQNRNCCPQMLELVFIVLIGVFAFACFCIATWLPLGGIQCSSESLQGAKRNYPCFQDGVSVLCTYNSYPDFLL